MLYKFLNAINICRKKMKESFKFQAPTTKVLKSASKNPLLSLSRPPISQKRLIHVKCLIIFLKVSQVLNMFFKF